MLKKINKAIVAAEKESVVIKKYEIIYQILEDLEKQMLSLLQPEIKEVELGKAEVRQVLLSVKLQKSLDVLLSRVKFNVIKLLSLLETAKKFSLDKSINLNVSRMMLKKLHKVLSAYFFCKNSMTFKKAI